MSCCKHCVDEITVTSLSQLNVGDHVSVCGRSFPINKFGYCKCVYRHHFIVTAIRSSSETVGEIETVGFEHRDESQKMSLSVRENTIEIDLKKSVYKVIKYLDQLPLDGKQRVAYARDQIAKQLQYSLRAFNCEHFCRTVCTNTTYSSQVEMCLIYLMTIVSIFNHLGCGYVAYLLLTYMGDAIVKENGVEMAAVFLIVVIHRIMFYYQFRNCLAIHDAMRKFVFECDFKNMFLRLIRMPECYRCKRLVLIEINAICVFIILTSIALLIDLKKDTLIWDIIKTFVFVCTLDPLVCRFLPAVVRFFFLSLVM